MTEADLLSMRLGEYVNGALCRQGCPICPCRFRLKWPTWMNTMPEALAPGQFNAEITRWLFENPGL